MSWDLPAVALPRQRPSSWRSSLPATTLRCSSSRLSGARLVTAWGCCCCWTRGGRSCWTWEAWGCYWTWGGCGLLGLAALLLEAAWGSDLLAVGALLPDGDETS